jgi:hypothetical protein
VTFSTAALRQSAQDHGCPRIVRFRDDHPSMCCALFLFEQEAFPWPISTKL